MPRAHRLLSPLALVVLLSATFALLHVAPAGASGSQEAIFQDDNVLHANIGGTLATLRDLGVQRVRVFIPWISIAPSPRSARKPAGFSASNPASYPQQNWSFYDSLVSQAKADGIGLDLTLTGGAPRWATGQGAPRNAPTGVWRPNPGEFGAFVRAVGTRYSGHYQGLPKVNFWAIWNEPNYGPDLAPQAIHHSTVEVSPTTYRGLLDAAWSALHATGHGRDTILFGEIAPRGQTFGDQPGNFSGMVPLRFLRALYCINSAYRPLRGAAAAARGCPTTSFGSRRFRGAHPALFQATGFADHPYPQGKDPLAHTWPNPGPDQYADMPQLPVLEGLLDRANRVYGSHTRFSIYSTEYGYQTRPPSRHFRTSAATAALWTNWAEYLSWRSQRVVSYMQYGLKDPFQGFFPSALEFSSGRRKAVFDAFRLPLYLPVTSTTHHRHSLEVWGDVRPAHYAILAAGSAQPAQIQFQRGSRGRFRTLKTVRVGGRGYFDVRVNFPASGSVRIEWVTQTGAPVFSRVQGITLR